MNSISRLKARRRMALRQDRMARREEDRIVVQHDGGVTSVLYRGENPSTRYLPPAQPVWGQIREAFRMG